MRKNIRFALTGLSMLVQACASGKPVNVQTDASKAFPNTAIENLVKLPGQYFTTEENAKVLERIAMARAIADNELNTSYMGGRPSNYFSTMKVLLERVDRDWNFVIDNLETADARKVYGQIAVPRNK